MALCKEKKMVQNSLQKLKDLKDFEEALDTPPNRITQLLTMGKNVTCAETYRKLGNEIFRKGGHDVCVHYSIINEYNRSIAWAPLNSEALALAYGNRSAIFEHIGRYKESILAIDMACSITKMPSLKIKMLCRKAKCEAALGLSCASKYLEQAKSCFKEFDQEEVAKKNLRNFIEKSEEFIKAKIQNPPRFEKRETEISELISKAKSETVNSVEIALSEKWGKHLIATRDIKPGEILILEAAFNTTISYPEATSFYCWHCSSFLWEIVPCDSCPYYCFCSEKCKAESWEQYHAVECDILTIIDTMYIHLSSFCGLLKQATVQLGLRLLIIAMKQAGNLRNLRTSLEKFGGTRDLDQLDNSSSIESYEHILDLPSNVTKHVLDSLANDAALYLVILAKFTSIFKEIFDPCDFNMTNLINSDDALFMGALLLKFCMISDASSLLNARSPDCKKKNPCGTIGCDRISMSLGLKTGLVGVSCVPNVRRCLVENNQIILYSLLPIKRGAQIFDTHGSIFAPVAKLERQINFKHRHGFSCSCQACKEDWPPIDLGTGVYKYYSKEASSLSERNRRLLFDYLSMFDRNRSYSSIEKISKFSKLIEDATTQSPLPSKISAYLIDGLISFMESTYGFSKQQVCNECIN